MFIVILSFSVSDEMMISTFRFKRALASRDEVIVTGPYLDQWGSGHIITISKAIVKTLAYANLKKTFF